MRRVSLNGPNEIQKHNPFQKLKKKHSSKKEISRSDNSKKKTEILECISHKVKDTLGRASSDSEIQESPEPVQRHERKFLTLKKHHSHKALEL